MYCLYHAVSLTFYGDTVAATELRARVAIEHTVNRQHYEGDEFQNVSDGLDMKLNCCASPGEYCGILVMVAAANVVDVNIVSVHPPVNGLTDRAFQATYTTIRPRSGSAGSVIHLLRTHLGSVDQSPVWTPNHFATVLPNAASDDLALFIDSSPTPPILDFILFNLYTHKTCLT